ncbi:mechanosensitive ion channel [Sulfurimonas gotlandica GD1]|uniref:Mechanosensitive ion channel n=1 Tax=Sulfurimonas gotlandica (strain DSM 19862 / JCM 16533 / GD1) TaxID=929558 RepID=B6BJR2_SULGG|nr:mechanosensitive ion channel domain-containing protein [Sulfurimonas gotlandica]EDZ62563.1 MscS Mechanosensitive ion channel [Sulfurimonas gotlandica GD1]EHP31310.1 mechanosensitive ion channel [Sulfurimonas gotlandica GD1]
MKKILFAFLFLASVLFAEVTEDKSTLSKTELKELEVQKEKERISRISDHLKVLQKIENEISEEKVWTKSYASYLTSLDVRNSLQTIKERIKYLQKIRKKTLSQQDELNALISKEKILTSQIEKLKEKDSAPFSKIITPPIIEDKPSITNPFDIFTGFSLIKTLYADYNDYIIRKDELTDLIALLHKENTIYKEIATLDINKEYVKDSEAKLKQIDRFETALDTMIVTAELYQKRLEIIEININKDIEVQVIKLAKIGVVVLVVFFIFFLLKFFVKKYITDNERFYMANKIITFINVTLIILIVFFNYIENASYLVTILGFASAGIAIAMKDWFMSMLGWLVIVIGGSIHVGDRIRVDMGSMKYVGDVMDISLLRMTILEDITLTSIMNNRRAGRIIFVPNNYVFTNMIANYTHSSLKTVWDGVAITITFDSNHKKAMHLAKEIVKKYSKGYTDITRKQLNKLRNQYSLKNTNVEPRIFSFIQPNGISIDSWYLTNAYATLTLRSVISVEIVDAFNAADDITIAYPTQKLHIQDERREAPFDTNEVV